MITFNDYNEKIIEYLGQGEFKFMLSKFLYYFRDSYQDFKIDDKEDLINIDFNKEFIVYENNNYYLYKIGTFDGDTFCRCQQGSPKLYLISFKNNKLFFDQIDENYEESCRVWQYHNILNENLKNFKKNNQIIEIDDKVNTDHIVYQKLIKPYLSVNLIEDTDKEIQISENFEIIQKYKINLMFFYYDYVTIGEREKTSFYLSFLNSYLLRGRYKINDYLYIEKFPPLKKNVLYYHLSIEGICCGSGEIFLYQIKHKNWLNFNEEQLQTRKFVYCLDCEEKLLDVFKKENYSYCLGDVCRAKLHDKKNKN